MANVDITALSIKVTSEGVTQASQQISGLSTSANNAEKRITSFTAAMDKLNSMSRLSTTAADSYMAKLREQAALLQTMSAGSRTAAGGTQALAAAMALLSSSLNLMNQNLQRADVHQRAHNNSMQEGRALARGLAGSLGALWMTYSAFTGMAIGVAIGASLKGIVSVGKEVENTLEGIRVRGGETVESVNKLRVAVSEVGQGVYGPKEVAEALHTLVLAGLSAEQALGSVHSALNLATVGEIPIEKAAAALVTIGTAMNYTAEGYSVIADVIAKTGAVSKASVDGLAESFKSSASVGALYKLSLTDIGASLAALANLGIERSSAGTALKNFYKDLTSGSDKAKKALHDMGLSMDSLRDRQGKMLDLASIFQKMSDGLQKYEGGVQSDILKNLFGERGIKLASEGIALVRKEAQDGSNDFVTLKDKIADSFGFAAIGAAQMALTTKSQLASLKNSLEVTFMGTFKDMEPQIAVFSARLKEAFKSEDFQNGLRNVAVLFADMAVWVANNIGLLTVLAKSFIALKVAMAIGELVMGLATGFAAVRDAMAGAALASKAFQLSLGILGGLLAGAATLWALFGENKTKATLGVQAQASLQYVGDYAEALDGEAKRLRTEIELLEKGVTARDASTEAMRRENAQRIHQKTLDAKLDADKTYNAAMEGASPRERALAKANAESGRRIGFSREDSLANAEALRNNTYNAAIAAEKAYLQNEEEVRKLAAKKAGIVNGTSFVGPPVPTANRISVVPEEPDTKIDPRIKKELTAFEALQALASKKLLHQEAQIEATHKLTDAEKTLLDVQEQLAKNALHASPQQQAKLAITEKALRQSVDYAYQQRVYATQQQEAYTASNKAIEAYEREADALEAKAKVVGLNKSETKAAELAEAEYALTQNLSMGVTTRHTAELMAKVDALRRSAAAEAMIESKKHGRTGEEGALEALKKYGEAANDTGSMVENALTNAFKGAEDALVNFVKTGKLDFKSFADAVITDLIRMQIRMAMGQAIGGGTGGIGSLANLFGGSAALTMNNAGMMMSEGISASSLLMAFADGGDPPVGVPSLVGERGPELFVPKQAGTIVPNHKLGGSSGSEKTSSSGEMKFTIVNQTTGRIDDVKEQRISDTERALIITEAVNATAASLYDSNSKVSKGMRNNFNSQRNR